MASEPTPMAVGADSERRLPLPFQLKVQEFYMSDHIQIFVAVLICANFLTNIIEKEIDPKGKDYADGFKVFEWFYNIVFTIELGFNLYGHWFREFWKSGWNIFDAVVVTIGVTNMLQLPLPPALKLLRMMRAFRVFRLFKRVQSLNQIIVAIARAVPGVMNAFLILGIVMSIYAILAVEFYHDMGKGCEDDPNTIWLTTRGFCWGWEYFGCFSKSLFTFFQVLTGDSWSEMVARPCIWYWTDEPLKAYAGGFFFVSYVLVTAFMLINVVVAVLLDKMQAPEEEPEALPEAEDGGASNGEVSKDGESTPELKVQAVEKKVKLLVSNREEVKRNLDSFREELAELKEKLALVIKSIGSQLNDV